MSDVLTELKKAAGDSRRADEYAAACRVEMAATARWAVGQGAPKIDVARICGVTRQTLDRWITEAE